eukprot:1174944-Amphidinium_carterae.1
MRRVFSSAPLILQMHWQTVSTWSRVLAKTFVQQLIPCEPRPHCKKAQAMHASGVIMVWSRHELSTERTFDTGKIVRRLPMQNENLDQVSRWCCNLEVLN